MLTLGLFRAFMLLILHHSVAISGSFECCKLKEKIPYSRLKCSLLVKPSKSRPVPIVVKHCTDRQIFYFHKVSGWQVGSSDLVAVSVGRQPFISCEVHVS